MITRRSKDCSLKAGKSGFPKGGAILRFASSQSCLHKLILGNDGPEGLSYAFEAAKACILGDRPKIDGDQHGWLKF